MIRTLRLFFLSRLLREKLLLVAFVAIGAVIWISGFSSRAGSFWRAQKVTTAQLKEQDKWLADRTKVEALAQSAAAQLQPAQTLDGTRLFTTVRQFAVDAGLRNARIDGTPQKTSNGQFSVNTLTLTAEATEQDALKNWEAIKKFYTSVQQKSPYIAIDQFTLQPKSAAIPGQLAIVLKVKSVEVH